ncbi:MAG: hypothetical protein QXT21_05130 [Thermoplasmata archaeon]
MSLSFELKKPIIYLGTGQDYKDLIKFDPKFILEKIFNNI